MKDIIVRLVDCVIFILCFLSLLSGFFYAISHTCIDKYMYTNDHILIVVWCVGVLSACLLTRPLYHLILHLRGHHFQDL